MIASSSAQPLAFDGPATNIILKLRWVLPAGTMHGALSSKMQSEFRFRGTGFQTSKFQVSFRQLLRERVGPRIVFE